jgi:hypothetical protein
MRQWIPLAVCIAVSLCQCLSVLGATYSLPASGELPRAVRELRTVPSPPYENYVYSVEVTSTPPAVRREQLMIHINGEELGFPWGLQKRTDLSAVVVDRDGVRILNPEVSAVPENTSETALGSVWMHCPWGTGFSCELPTASGRWAVRATYQGHVASSEWIEIDGKIDSIHVQIEMSDLSVTPMIIGRVVDSEGHGVSGAEVHFLHGSRSVRVRVVGDEPEGAFLNTLEEQEGFLTDEAGSFSFRSLEYREMIDGLHARDSGGRFGLLDLGLPESHSSDEFTEVSDLENLKITLSEPVSVEGCVSREGEPVGRTMMLAHWLPEPERELEIENLNWFMMRAALTRPDGTFTMGPFPRGTTWRIEPSIPDVLTEDSSSTVSIPATGVPPSLESHVIWDPGCAIPRITVIDSETGAAIPDTVLVISYPSLNVDNAHGVTAEAMWCPGVGPHAGIVPTRHRDGARGTHSISVNTPRCRIDSIEGVPASPLAPVTSVPAVNVDDRWALELQAGEEPHIVISVRVTGED